MKKIALLLAIVLLVAAPLTVQAATPRLITILPELTYTGTTANCSVRIIGNNTAEEVYATIKLWYGTTCLETWHVTGNGYVFWKDTATVTSGRTYKLTVDATIDGDQMDQVYVTSNCP